MNPTTMNEIECAHYERVWPRLEEKVRNHFEDMKDLPLCYDFPEFCSVRTRLRLAQDVSSWGLEVEPVVDMDGLLEGISVYVKDPDAYQGLADFCAGTGFFVDGKYEA